jgi:hypothetical protein
MRCPKATAKSRSKAEMKMPGTQATLGEEILQEVFHSRPSDVEDIIHSRLDERSHRRNEEEGLWPAVFSLGECRNGA